MLGIRLNIMYFLLLFHFMVFVLSFNLIYVWVHSDTLESFNFFYFLSDYLYNL